MAAGSGGALKRGNAGGAKGPYGVGVLCGMGGRGDMTTAPRSLNDLQRRIDGKAQAAPSWRCWGLDVHVGTMETRRAA